MELDTDRLKGLMSHQYDPGTAAPSPKYRHFEEFRRKEFEAGDLAERFHENTKYTERSERSDGPTMSLFVRDDTMQFATARARHDYRGRERVDLPDPADLDADLSEVLSRRRSLRRYGGDPITRQALSTLLAYGCGVNGSLGPGDGSEPTRTTGRTYPSGGGLYPVENYLAVLNGGPELDEGLYYYVPDDHALRVLAEGAVTDEIDDAFVPPAGMEPSDAAVCFLLTGAFWRSKAKYGPRGYRFVLQESGHLVQNLLLVGLALGYGGVPLGAVREDRANDLLGVDGVDEALVYSLFLGAPPRGGGDE